MENYHVNFYTLTQNERLLWSELNLSTIDKLEEWCLWVEFKSQDHTEMMAQGIHDNPVSGNQQGLSNWMNSDKKRILTSYTVFTTNTRGMGGLGEDKLNEICPVVQNTWNYFISEAKL